jgi:hypothetical protein
VHSYSTAYWWGAAFFAFGAVLTALLYRRRSTPVAPTAGTQAAEGAPEPVIAH